jgi:dihydrofolate reductase
MISLVVAMTPSGVIGRAGSLPWYEPADLRRFRSVTWNKTLVFGRTTWDGLACGQRKSIQQGRHVIVLTSRPIEIVVGDDEVTPVNSLRDALGMAEMDADGETMVCGGAAVYRQCLPLAGRVYLTELRDEIEGDVRFPHWDRSGWVAKSREEVAGVKYPHTFSVLERVRR